MDNGLYVNSALITSIRGSTSEILGGEEKMSNMSIHVSDSGDKEYVIYHATLKSGPFEHKDKTVYYEDAKEDWKSDIDRKNNEYMKEIIIEIIKRIDAANQNKEQIFLDFSTLDLHK